MDDIPDVRKVPSTTCQLTPFSSDCHEPDQPGPRQGGCPRYRNPLRKHRRLRLPRNTGLVLTIDLIPCPTSSTFTPNVGCSRRCCATRRVWSGAGRRRALVESYPPSMWTGMSKNSVYAQSLELNHTRKIMTRRRQEWLDKAISHSRDPSCYGPLET